MITLYGMGSPNVVKIYIALEELALPYTVQPVDVFTGKQFDDAFLKLNPNAKVPVIVDLDGPGGRPYTCFEFRRDPALSGGKDRQAAAEGHRDEVRRDSVADDSDVDGGADVRPVRAFSAVCTGGQ